MMFLSFIMLCNTIRFPIHLTIQQTKDLKYESKVLIITPFSIFRHLLLSVEQDDVATIYLPQLSKDHLLLVLDYVYKGRMYIKANQLQYVLGVIEVLSLECGVSVTKKVRKEPKDPWVEGGVFTSFTEKGKIRTTF